ncbi:hypothetical protein M0R45_017386 [Rubus argutus]|uniref:FAD-binding domain-containing protein n=1 Tax=Rubus argutus TaxID=59490 RepID=A0AAW1XW17_RUBAR
MNSELSSLTLTGTKYRPPWDLLFQGFRKGTVTVAGDTMHVMGPFLGQGGSAALEDAVVLARCLGRQYCLEMKREWMETALDQYVKERSLRLLHLSTKTFTIGSLMESSVLVKILCVVVLIIFFGDRLGYTRYDCGPL